MKTEVLVVGGGPGGLAAALAAAREGVETVLLDRYGSFGGNITQSQVETIAWYRHELTVEAGGIALEFETRAQEMGGTHKDPEAQAECLDADMFKSVADTLVAEAGVLPVLHGLAVEPIVEGGVIQGVIIESKSGRQAILAQRVIDATGDADIASRAGAPFRKAQGKEMMSATMSFGCSGVDVQRFLSYVRDNPARLKDWAGKTSGKEDDLFTPYIEEPFRAAAKTGEIPKGMRVEVLWHSLTEAGEATHINAVRIMGIDPTNIMDLTRAEIEGRRHALLILKVMQKAVPGFEKAKLRTFAPCVGVRSSRKIIGEYNITEDDVRNQARFEDSIGIVPEFLDGYGLVIIPTTGRYFQVPYGVTLPQQIENLLVAGRCIGGDRLSHAATRQMVCCAVTGQGTGIAAAQSLKDKRTCREVDRTKVQNKLQKQGVRIY